MAERSRPAEAAGWRDRCASSGRASHGLLLRRMVGLRILGSGFWWIGFWVVVASWNRRCFQDRSRRPSDSLYCDRAHCDFQRQFDGPLACSLFKPPPRCHHLKAAGAARSCSGRSLVHFCGGVRTTTQKWFGGQRSRPAEAAGWRDRCASSGRVGQGLLLRRMVGLRILGSGSSWIGFWVVVASWNRRCFQDRSRRASDSLRRDRGCCDFQRQFDGPLACSASQPTPRCHHLKAAVAAR